MNVNKPFNDYNSLKGHSLLSYNIIKFLKENNEDIWKILKYNEPDCLSKPNLTDSEKNQLIYNGELDSENFKVFRDEFPSDDLFVDTVSQLRIFPSMTDPVDRNFAIQNISFQFVCHVKINHIENYTTRIDTVTEQIISTLNGQDIGFMSPLYFDSSNGRGAIVRRSNIGNNKNFSGVMIVMSCKVGGSI